MSKNLLQFENFPNFLLLFKAKFFAVGGNCQISQIQWIFRGYTIIEFSMVPETCVQTIIPLNNFFLLLAINKVIFKVGTLNMNLDNNNPTPFCELK